MTLLEVSNLNTGYGSSHVLKDLCFSVSAGEAVAVLGANGAGKSTLMKSIVGLVKPWSGQIRFEGEVISGKAAEGCASLGITLAPEGRSIFTTLSIEENLRIGATRLQGKISSSEFRKHCDVNLQRIYELFPVLGKRRTNRGSSLSGGQQQMLAIGRALMSDPKLLILDEPCLGLSPKIGGEVYEILQIVREGGQSLIIVEESTKRALQFADRACVLKLGQKVVDSPVAELANSEALLTAYFGIEKEPHN
jgi:branched-chain amino acid transport system ATP-binding protein